MAGAGFLVAGHLAFTTPAKTVTPGGVRALHTRPAPQSPVALQNRAGLSASAEATTSTSWSPLRLFASAALTLAGAAAHRGRKSRMACRATPSLHKPRQKVLRRLEPYGQIPGWTAKPLLVRRKKKLWLKRPPPRPTTFGRRLIEKQRIKYHYNVLERTMRVYMTRALKKGVEYPIDNLLQQLESRLDSFIYRVGLAPTMPGARNFLQQGHIEIRRVGKLWKVMCCPSCRLQPGDQVRVRRRYDWRKSIPAAKYWQDMEGPIDVPPHLQWDRENFSGAYLGLCDRHDFGLHVEERLVIQWHRYTSQRGLRRTHLRYFEGTTRIIKKGYRGGRIRPTPENRLNMERGIGLFKRGRSKPPCLWGRSKPLNSPYHRLR